MSMRALITMMAAMPAYPLPKDLKDLTRSLPEGPEDLPRPLKDWTREAGVREEKMAKAAAKRMRRQAKRLAEGRHL